MTIYIYIYIIYFDFYSFIYGESNDSPEIEDKGRHQTAPASLQGNIKYISNVKQGVASVLG